MKKVLVYGALCALTLAIPAAAEKVYVPVLGATKLWVASADGVDRAVSTGRVGLVAVDADSYENARALLDDRLEVPAFTEEETYQAGLEVPLGDLPRPREMKSLTVGAANLSEQTASCPATPTGGSSPPPAGPPSPGLTAAAWARSSSTASRCRWPAAMRWPRSLEA